MSVLKPVVYDGGMQRQVQQGDLVGGAEVLPATIATAGITITGQQLMSGYIRRSPAGAGTDTIDSAANIISAMIASMGAVQNGTTFKCRWITSTAQVVTVTATANTGITVNLPTVNASSAKEFLVTVVNGTPAQTFVGMTVNATAVVTIGSAQCALLSPGMIVTNAVNGLQGTTIVGINQAAGTVTMSGNANATSVLPGVAIAFSPVVTLDGIGQMLI